jgi:hypothetical protein
MWYVRTVEHRRQECVEMAAKTSSDSNGEVREMAREIAREEQYWILADRSAPHKPPRTTTMSRNWRTCRSN